MSFSIAFSASARYIAPLSRFTYPNLRARREAMVLLPAPAGPSMAMVNLRRDGSFFSVSVMRSNKLYTLVEKDSPRGLKLEDVSVYIDGADEAFAKKLYRSR